MIALIAVWLSGLSGFFIISELAARYTEFGAGLADFMKGKP